MSTMNFETWWATYKPVKNHITGRSDGPSITNENGEPAGGMFHRGGDELAYVREVAATEPGRVWSILDCDGIPYIVNGMHVVNLEGYYVTENAFDGDFLEVCVYDEDELEFMQSQEEEDEDLENDDDLTPPAPARPKP
jgi:hypothetical protein